MDGGKSVVLDRSVDKTIAGLGVDAAAYERTFRPLAAHWDELVHETLGPLHIPRYPFVLARFGLLAPWPATAVARSLFRAEEARALFAGNAAHSTLPLERSPSAAFGMILATAGHAVGWPVPRGGSQRIANALASYFESLGGTIVPNAEVRSLADVKGASTVMGDITPRQLLRIAGAHLPESYSRQLETYRYGPGVFKMDWALDGPIPWASSDCARAGTVHIGGTLDEVAAAERAPFTGERCERPFVLLAQPSLFDSTRAPAGKHTVWAYCHVPNGSHEDMTERIEGQIERFAPGFRALILARSVMRPADLERHNANLVGGDINGGVQDLPQLFLRPTPSLYSTPLDNFYLCSSSTPPGGGVHGMCGYHAARRALKNLRGSR